MKKIVTTCLMLLAVVAGANAQTTFTHHDGMDCRVGYNIGGTMPVGMPAEIRSLNSYTPQANIQMGIDYEFSITSHWGVTTGLHLDKKAMKTDAQVKGYHMTMVQGGESIDGLFTGGVVTKASTWSVSIPVMADYWVNKNLKLKFGPYISDNIDKQFNGWAYDGYLRKDSPTGERIEIGYTEEERGEYDFKDNLRTFGWGLDFGADLYLYNGWGLYADLQWGMSGAFKSSFQTISQSMHPIYGTIGIVKGF